MHACGCDRNRGHETNVLIISVSCAIVVYLTLRSDAQGRIEIVGMRKQPILVGLGTFPVAIMGDAEIEDEVPLPSRVLEVVDNLDVAALLSPRVTGRDSELCAHLMAGRTEKRSENRYHPVVRLGGTCVAVQVVAVNVQRELSVPAARKGKNVG